MFQIATNYTKQVKTLKETRENPKQKIGFLKLWTSSFAGDKTQTTRKFSANQKNCRLSNRRNQLLISSYLECILLKVRKCRWRQIRANLCKVLTFIRVMLMSRKNLWLICNTTKVLASTPQSYIAYQTSSNWEQSF
jgi:hypothetical protein